MPFLGPFPRPCPGHGGKKGVFLQKLERGRGWGDPHPSPERPKSARETDGIPKKARKGIDPLLKERYRGSVGGGGENTGRRKYAFTNRREKRGERGGGLLCFLLESLGLRKGKRGLGAHKGDTIAQESVGPYSGRCEGKRVSYMKELRRLVQGKEEKGSRHGGPRISF